MNIKRDNERYLVEGTKPGTFYSVDLYNNTCTCPHYVHRMKRIKGDCKHLKAVKESVSSSTPDEYDEIVKLIKENVFVDSIELIDKFGEERINELIKNGELIEEHGKIRLL
jgi:hypothetical protein